MVELHRGSIWAYSPGPGQGSEFRFVLPLAAPPGVPVSRPRVPSGSGKERILIIEDNRDAAEMLRQLLELSGYTVYLAFNGPDGISAAREFRPEVILCDIGLPGMDGYEVAAALRGDPDTHARLIAVSGYARDGDRRRAREVGFDEHLTKPVAFEELEAMLASLDDGEGASLGESENHPTGEFETVLPQEQ